MFSIENRFDVLMPRWTVTPVAVANVWSGNHPDKLSSEQSSTVSDGPVCFMLIRVPDESDGLEDLSPPLSPLWLPSSETNVRFWIEAQNHMCISVLIIITKVMYVGPDTDVARQHLQAEPCGILVG